MTATLLPLLLLTLPVASKGNGLTLLYTGDNAGEIEPCG